MSHITIDDDIPLPENIGAPRTRYPWDKLAVGQSFFIPGENATRAAPKRLLEQGWVFVSAPETDRYGDKGRRFWRTA